MMTKTTFRLYRTRDGRLLIESPRRTKNDGQEVTDMLVVSSDDVVVKGDDLHLSFGFGFRWVGWFEDKRQAYPTESGSILSSQEIFGVLGLIELCFAKYLLVVTNRVLAGTIQAHKVWRITNALAVPVGSSTDVELMQRKEKLDEKDLAKYTLDRELLESIVSIARSGHLYYSSTYDLTHSVQHNYFSKVKKPQNTTVDDRYFFNKHLQEPLLESAACAPWVFKTICGFAGSIDINVAIPTSADQTPINETFTVTLISRLNNRRLGTRYVRRGLDWDGNAANNVEMEQIVFNEDFLKDKAITSFVQIRGSAPAIWGQELDLSYRPEMLVADINKPKVWEAISKHYEDLLRQYTGEKAVNGGSDHGKVCCVNLLDTAGFEGHLTATYEKTADNYKKQGNKFGTEKLHYEEFPVNKWCKKANFRNMDILIARMRDNLINSGFFVAEGSVPAAGGADGGEFRVSRIQTGLARVSCLDSLDRTNLTCSLFARYMLPFQIQTISPDLPDVSLQVNSTAAEDVMDPVADTRKALEPTAKLLTNLWADSGDAISILYAGTRALKGDVTRTGQRSWIKGSADDLLNSLTRYYLNNFADGRKQDAYDLWSGKVTSPQIHNMINTEGVRKARHQQRPFIEKDRGVGWLLPSFVVDRVEPLLQAAWDFAGATAKDQVQKAQKLAYHIGEDGAPTSYVGFLVAAIKIYAPERVNGVVEFIVAMVVFFYILVIVKIFQIKGQEIVDKPKLIGFEYATIHEMLD
ncbi:hypothetical protein HK102_013156 [Quaeritorhiza haematococci]|nr:hypothetical protein HK102_013156 [Quaeritorhiza haematococci]